MIKNRFYTLVLIPEKSSKLRKVILPTWVMRGFIIGVGLIGIVGFMMVMDYWYVMGQIDEIKELKIENRKLRSQVQVYQNRMETIENTLNRIDTFSTRLKIITNIEDRESLVSKVNSQQDLPDSAMNVGIRMPASLEEIEAMDEHDPERQEIERENRILDLRFTRLQSKSLLSEQTLEDLYELLSDQKDLLSALPTRKPASGTYTSGFGIRPSPYGGRERMHEGIDIANYIGTNIFTTAAGIVKFAGQKPGYGRLVVIDHGYGMETWYGHVRQLLVREGEKVKRGGLIAKMGNSGRSTGPHVHYEVRVHGIPVDPLSYILEE